MTDYTELVKALRWCASDETDCEGNCPYSFMTDCLGKIKLDAAAAIEELQAEVNEQKQIAAHYEQAAKDYWKEACDYKTAWEVEREDRLKIEPPQEVQE